MAAGGFMAAVKLVQAPSWSAVILSLAFISAWRFGHHGFHAGWVQFPAHAMGPPCCMGAPMPIMGLGCARFMSWAERYYAKRSKTSAGQQRGYEEWFET